MDISKMIKKILIDEDMNMSQLADKLDTSQQNLSAKLKRNNPSLKEMQEIAEALGYELNISFTRKG